MFLKIVNQYLVQYLKIVNQYGVQVAKFVWKLSKMEKIEPIFGEIQKNKLEKIYWEESKESENLEILTKRNIRDFQNHDGMQPVELQKEFEKQPVELQKELKRMMVKSEGYFNQMGFDPMMSTVGNGNQPTFYNHLNTFSCDTTPEPSFIQNMTEMLIPHTGLNMSNMFPVYPIGSRHQDMINYSIGNGIQQLRPKIGNNIQQLRPKIGNNIQETSQHIGNNIQETSQTCYIPNNKFYEWDYPNIYM
eukprot:UN22467